MTPKKKSTPTQKGLYPSASDEEISIALELEICLYNELKELKPAIKDLIRQYPIGKNRVRAVFEDVFGCSPSQYYRRERFLSQRRMVVQSRLEVGAISDMFNYRDSDQFYSAFKRYFGMSPEFMRYLSL